MINLRVFNIKKIIKYLVIAFGVIFLTFYIFPFIFNIKLFKFSPSILNQTIPGIGQLNNISSSIELSYLEPKNKITSLLQYQLPITSSIKLASHESDDTIFENSYNKENLKNANDNENNKIQPPESNLETQIIPNNVPDKFNTTYKGVKIKNTSKHTLTDDILNFDNINIDKSNIMIFHTHTCESYTPTENFSYTPSGNFRTTDLNYSVSRVGDVLSEQLTSYGYNVIHNKNFHDYPSYNGSYGRSLETVKNLLNTNKSDIIIDLHRDAIADSTYAPSVKIGDEVVSQLMFVIGTDGGGLEHPNWRENLKFAIKVQAKANEMYPGLFRSILVRDSRYNQHLGKAACLIEVGSTGNTLEQSMASMKYLAKILNSI